MKNKLIAGTVEWNVKREYRGFPGKTSKYDEVQKIFDKLEVHTSDDDGGWVKIQFNNMKDARRAQTAMSQYVARNHKDATWRHQTSVSQEDGMPFLYLRKVPKS